MPLPQRRLILQKQDEYVERGQGQHPKRTKHASVPYGRHRRRPPPHLPSTRSKTSLSLPPPTPQSPNLPGSVLRRRLRRQTDPRSRVSPQGRHRNKDRHTKQFNQLMDNGRARPPPPLPPTSATLKPTTPTPRRR